MTLWCSLFAFSVFTLRILYLLNNDFMLSTPCSDKWDKWYGCCLPSTFQWDNRTDRSNLWQEGSGNIKLKCLRGYDLLAGKWERTSIHWDTIMCKHCAKHFIYIVSKCSQQSCKPPVIGTFYQWGLKRLNNLPKVTRVIEVGSKCRFEWYYSLVSRTIKGNF